MPSPILAQQPGQNLYKVKLPKSWGSTVKGFSALSRGSFHAHVSLRIFCKTCWFPSPFERHVKSCTYCFYDYFHWYSNRIWTKTLPVRFLGSLSPRTQSGLISVFNYFDILIQLHLDAAPVEKPKEHEVDWFAEHTGASPNSTELAFNPQVTPHSHHISIIINYLPNYWSFVILIHISYHWLFLVPHLRYGDPKKGLDHQWWVKELQVVSCFCVIEFY